MPGLGKPFLKNYNCYKASIVITGPQKDYLETESLYIFLIYLSLPYCYFQQIKA